MILINFTKRAQNARRINQLHVWGYIFNVKRKIKIIYILVKLRNYAYISYEGYYISYYYVVN